MQRLFGWVSGSGTAKAAADANDSGDDYDTNKIDHHDAEDNNSIDDYEEDNADDIYDTDGEESVEQDEKEEVIDENDGGGEAGDDEMTDQENDAEEDGAAEETMAWRQSEEIFGMTGQNDDDQDPKQVDEENDNREADVNENEDVGVNDNCPEEEQPTNNPPHNDIKSTTEANNEEGDNENSSLNGDTTKNISFAEIKEEQTTTTPPPPPPSIDKEEAKLEPDEHDSYPKAREFLVVDMDYGDDGITLTNQAAAEIVEGFNNEDEDDNDGDDGDESKTIATHRTAGGTRVQHVSAAYRTAMAQKEETEQMRHPHQSIFDILDRNFEQLGDGGGGGSARGGGGGGSKKVGYKDVKLCFVAFVAVFSLPSEPIFANEEMDNHVVSNDNQNDDQMDSDSENEQRSSPGAIREEILSTTQDKKKEPTLQKVPLSVAFALWSKVLQQPGLGLIEQLGMEGKNTNDHLSYIRSTLVLLGMLDLASIEIDRDDGMTPTKGKKSFGYSNKSIECLVVHDNIHQQYGEYLAWGDHEGTYRSLIKEDAQRWNEAAMKESELIGSNQYTLRMLPLNTMRAHHYQEAFNLLNEKTFVRRRMRVLGASGAAKAHVGDIEELLGLIEKQGDTTAESIDEQEGLLGAYQQVLKYCLHETEELTKHHQKDDEGNAKLGKSVMHKVADSGNALHLLGASLGGYGFFKEEMDYYKEALRLKKLSVNGDISACVSASDTLHSMGFSLDNAGKSDEALELYDQALEIRYECLGDDDLRVAETQHNKGALLCEEDRAEEAMECLEDALRIREIHYGEEHESCADTMQWMGNLLRKHGDPSEALDYFKFALSIKQKRLGGDDVDVANTLFNTAVLLDDIEKYELSLVAYKEALRIRKLVLGEKNQEVADTLFCIGNVTAVVENHEEALGCYKEAIEIREAMIKDDDLTADELDDTLLFISNPTSPRPDLLSQYERLSQCCEEALPLTKLISGTNHPDVCHLLNRMGEVYAQLHDWDNAVGSFQGALRVKRANVPEGEDDLTVTALLQKKGEAHLYKGEADRAKVHFDSAKKIAEKISGANSMSVASATYCLGVAYHYLNDYSHAKLLFQECLRIRAKLAGENIRANKLAGEDYASVVVRSLCWIGRQHEKLNEPKKALERSLQALQVYKKEKASIDYRIVAMLLHSIGSLYEDDKINLQEMALKCYTEEISVINSKLDVEEMQITRMLAEAHFKPGMLYKKRGDVEKPIEHLEKALELTKSCDGEINIRIATISDNLGMLHATRKEFDVAKKYYSSAYSVYEKCIGRDDLTTSDCAFRLGKVLEALKSNLSLEFYKESLRVHRLNVTEDNERIGEILFCSGRVLLETGAYQDAVKRFEEALGIRRRLLGDCSEVADTYHNLGKTFSEMSQSEKALIFFKESVRINKKIGKKEALYKVSFDMAQCAASCSQFQLAIDCYSDCIQGTESMDNHGTDTAQVLQHMGEIQMEKLHNYADATKVLLDALEIRRGVEDEDNCEDEHTMNLVLLIAQAYASAKDYKKSLNYYEEHTNLLESNTPENEDALADSLLAMGIIYSMKAYPDYDLAIEKIIDCVEIKKKLFGSDEEQVANVVYTLATVYEKSGDYDEAVQTLAKALRSFQMKRNKAGSVKVYHTMGRLKATKAAELNSARERSAAIECYEKALQIRRQIMSLDDIELASMLYEYASLLTLNNKHEMAHPSLEEALRIQKSKSGLKDKRVATTLLRMAEVHVHQQKYDASLVCLEQVILIQSALEDADDDYDDEIDMGSCHHLLGTTYLARGDPQKAITSYLECMEMKQSKYGSYSLECAAVHNDLGKAYGKVHNFDKAIESLVEALKIRKTELGNNSLDYGHSVYNLAQLHIAMTKNDQALNCLSEAVRVYELFPDDMGEKMVEVLETKGDTLHEIQDYEAAVDIFQECLDLLDSNEPDDSSSHESSKPGDERAARMHHKMGHALAKLGEYDEAFDSYREAISIYSDVLGKNDLHVGGVMSDVGHLIVSQGGENIAEQSMECFNEVIRIYGDNRKEKDTKVADALFQKSTLLADSSEYDEVSAILDEAIVIYRESLGYDAIEIGKAMLLRGRVHDAQGKDEKALEAYDEALRIFQVSLGEEDINVSIALSNIGILHARKQEYAEAVEKCKMALRIRVMRGDQDQDVADSVFNIANILNDSGEVDEAYQYFQQSLKLYIDLLGEDDISVANCQLKLGEIYWSRNDIDRSLQSFLDALRICDEEEEDAVISMLASIYRGIGDCYYNKGEDDKALENFAKCLRILKMELGDDCIEMAEPCDFIGLIYQKKFRYEEAQNFHSKALTINESHHGKGSKECTTSDFLIAKCLLASHEYEECITHLQTHLVTYCQGSEDDGEVADVYHPLGLAQSKLGKYDESVASLKKALNIRTKLFGKTHLKVAETMLDIGKVFEECGDSEEAIPVYDQAITILQKIPNGDLHVIASAYSRLGALLEEKGNCEASLHSWKKALKIFSKEVGSDSIEVGETLFHIGKSYDNFGNYDKSSSCFSEVVKIFRSKAEDNEMVGQALGYIGKNYARKKQYAKAVEISCESLGLQKQFAQAGAIAQSLVDVGNILKAWGKADQAIQFFEEALRTYEEASGIEASEVATCRHNIGILKKQVGETETALSYFGEALRVHRMNEGDNSLNVADNLFQIGQIYDSFGKKEKCLKCFEECYKIRNEILGDDHLDVMAAQRYMKLASKKMKYRQY